MLIIYGIASFKLSSILYTDKIIEQHLLSSPTKINFKKTKNKINVKGGEKTRIEKALLLLLIILAMSSITLSGVPSTLATPTNAIWFENSHGYWLSTDLDVVNNVPMPRTYQWLFQISNQRDGTGATVVNPKITVLTDKTFINFVPNNPIITPGQYQWSYDAEVPESFSIAASAREENYFDYAKPGFFAERNISPETLSDPITTQTLSITFVREDPFPAYVNSVDIQLDFPRIAFAQTPLVEYSIISVNDVEDWVSTTFGWQSNPANIVLGKTYNFIAILQAEKSPDLGGAPIAKPWIRIGYEHWDNFGLVATGSSASVLHPEGPLLVVSADGIYDWYGSDSLARQDFIFNQVVSQIILNPNPPPPYIVKLPATFDFKPDSYNIARRTDQVTGYIELPEGYDVHDIDISTLKLGNQFPALSKPIAFGDYDRDGILDLMVKFNVADAQFPSLPQKFIQAPVTMTGRLYDQTLIEGTDIVKLILK